MRNIGKNNKISMLLGLVVILGYSNYTFAANAVIQNTNPTDTGPGQWPTPRFEPAKNADNSECEDANYDKLTGLMWAKNGSASGLVWAGAKTYASNLILCGYNDWRLPTINELRSLINYSATTSPANWLNSKNFSNISKDNYWSSTSYSLRGGKTWGVNMGTGLVYNYSQTDAYYVLPVRER
ncbi:DUF1566 domain-containing protein [Cysteiniphilum marinum]|uniref:Lcl C-terminal domain-containing protein n=1 Tax=Cysteiniphilum marinum TaxID=2774191 RepID=UPI00178082CE|nr:DUF1566 domain-containing protein [Cysteiniphilum marinum]